MMRDFLYGLYGLYEILCFFIPVLIWQVINRKHISEEPYKVRHLIWTYIFLIYCFMAAIMAAGIGTIWDLVYFKHLLKGINMRLFAGGYLVQYYLNVFMFMPLGFLTPFIWSKWRKWYKTVFLGFIFSLLIELCQLFNYRATDIDDILMNTLGAFVGYVLWLVFHRIFKKAGAKSLHIKTLEPVYCILLGIVGHFLLFSSHLF